MNRDFFEARTVLVDAEIPNGTPYEAKAASYSGASNQHLTPAAGKRLSLQYVCLSADGQNGADVTVTLRFGANSPLYKVSLVPGALWARNIGAGRRELRSGVNEPLVVELSVAATVHVSTEHMEF